MLDIKKFVCVIFGQDNKNHMDFPNNDAINSTCTCCKGVVVHFGYIWEARMVSQEMAVASQESKLPDNGLA